MILSFLTNRSEQTVQTQIRLLLDQGLHCHSIYIFGRIIALFKFQGDYSKFSGVRNFRIFMVKVNGFYPLHPCQLSWKN